MRAITFAITVLALSVGLAVPAVAQQAAAGNGYSDVQGQTQAQVRGGNGPSGTASGGDQGVQAVNAADTGSQSGQSGSGSLPFTGMDLLLLAAAGGVLGIAGFGLRRLTRIPESI